MHCANRALDGDQVQSEDQYFDVSELRYHSFRWSVLIFRLHRNSYTWVSNMTSEHLGIWPSEIRRWSLRVGIDIILSGFRHCSWDTKKVLIKQTIKKRWQNEVREWGKLLKKPALEKRERELELERAAKRQKLDEPSEQVSNLSFEGNENKEKENISWGWHTN